VSSAALRGALDLIAQGGGVVEAGAAGGSLDFDRVGRAAGGNE